MTYPRAENFLNSFINYERLNLYPYKSSFKLARMQGFLQSLGHPQENLKVIHIAGTKGKGSTSSFAACILKAAGLKVGLYTSPHLIDVRERIRVMQNVRDDKISQNDFARLMEKIRPSAEKLRETKLGGLSFFEILTAIAFLYFQEKHVDFAVLETGLGGRLDATNTVSSLVCAITPISYEHTQVLGNTLTEIAEEKAGIIKRKWQSSKCKVVVTAPQRPSALKVLKRRAKECGAKLVEVGKDIQIKERSASIKGQLFDLWGMFAAYPNLKIRLLGKHQLINAATAVAVVESLHYYGIKILKEAIKEGLQRTTWPGRLQIISRRPRIILDAAHNRASAFALKESLAELFKFRKLILVLGVSQNKDVKGILSELTPVASKIILTKANNPRAMEPEALQSYIKINERPIVLTHNSHQALKVARQSAGRQDLVLVSGSLFLVGEVLKNEKSVIR